jgi:hypothetical protein
LAPFTGRTLIAAPPVAGSGGWPSRRGSPSRRGHPAGGGLQHDARLELCRSAAGRECG